MIVNGGKALNRLGGPKALPNLIKLRIPLNLIQQTDYGC